MSTALAEVSKSDLVERLERMRNAARLAKVENEKLLMRGLGVIAANAGGALAAVVHHYSTKILSSKYAEKAPWGVTAIIDIAALAYDGEGSSAISAFSHGMSGYLTGAAVAKILP